MSTLALADQCFGALSARNPDFSGVEDPADRRRIAQRWREVLRSSTRYYLDEEITQASVALGVQHPDLLAGMLARARTPFEKVWIEWPLEAALEAVGREHDPDESPARLGVVLERLHESVPLYRLTTLNTAMDQAFVDPVSILYHLTTPLEDLQGEARAIVRRHSQINVTHKGQSTKVSFLMGSAYVESPSVDGEEVAWRNERLRALAGHAAFVFSPMMGERLQARIAKGSAGADLAVRLVNLSLRESAGIWRHVVGFLALLNAHNVVDQTAGQRCGQGRRMVLRQLVPYLDHRLVRLSLPRRAAIDRVIREARDSVPRRAHSVGGHWRERRSSGDPHCDHVWIDQSATRSECAICQRRAWWTNDFTRGTAEMGFVSKDYAVTGR